MTTHAEARALATEALLQRFGRAPHPGEVVHLAGISRLESSYGDGWKGAGRGSNNMGAIQCGAKWKGDRFTYTDTKPLPDGTSKSYVTSFRKYATPLEGWLDLVAVAYVNRGRETVRSAAEFQDTLGVSTELHRTGYYEGFGKTVDDRIQNHYRLLARAIKDATGAGESAKIRAIPPTIRRGCRGDVVKLLQAELRLARDGIFGPITEAMVKDYQHQHRLTMDGVVGRNTWLALFGDDYVPTTD